MTQASRGTYPADFIRIDICTAHAVLEEDFRVGNVLHERPSNQRRQEATADQLKRMGFRPGAASTFSDLNENAAAIYVNAVMRLGLSFDDELTAWAKGRKMTPGTQADTIAASKPDAEAVKSAKPFKPPILKRSPTPAEVVAARTVAGHTQLQAGLIVFSGRRAWQQWEAGEREMNPSVFRDYLRETKQKIPPGDGWS